MGALYNEIDPYAAQWMRNLIAAGDIASGVVDERSIAEITPVDVAGAGQRHFFAGIGGWSLGLRLAGWPDDVDVWTGSCPCQPFSSASRGRGGGFDSPKHLWPVWRKLVAECRPAVILGEQVATGDGPSWYGQVVDDLEALGYSVGAINLCASVLGFAPRQRLFFVAHTDGKGECARALDGKMARVSTASDLAPNEQHDVHGVVQERDGFPAAMGQRRAYGNAVNPRVTALFVRAVMDLL